MIKEHQTIGIDYQQTQDENYIEDSMTQQYMKFDEDHRDESRYWDHTFSQAKFDQSNKKYKQPLTRRGERNFLRRKMR